MNLQKILSGRLILTVISGGVFAWCACKGILEAQATAAILGSVFMSYFNRSDRAGQKPPGAAS